MKKTIFLAIILLTLQGFSQNVKNGVYKVGEVIMYEWNEEQTEAESFVYERDYFFHITDNHFRWYYQSDDTGDVYNIMYIGVMEDGFDAFAVPFESRLEIKDELAVLYFDFDRDTGWFKSSLEFKDLEYFSKRPILKHEN